jgi:hypothetical protein
MMKMALSSKAKTCRQVVGMAYNKSIERMAMQKMSAATKGKLRASGMTD